MTRFLVGPVTILAALLAVLLLTPMVRGDDPPQEDPLPPPRLVPPPVQVLPPPVFIRPNRYDVWQYYGVDRQGRFRPLVIASPHGPYYLLTGKAYPWAMLHSLNWLPYVAH